MNKVLVNLPVRSCSVSALTELAPCQPTPLVPIQGCPTRALSLSDVVIACAVSGARALGWPYSAYSTRRFSCEPVFDSAHFADDRAGPIHPL